MTPILITCIKIRDILIKIGVVLVEGMGTRKMDNKLKKTNPTQLHTQPDTTNKCKIFKPTMHYGEEAERHTGGVGAHTAVTDANGRRVTAAIALC